MARGAGTRLRKDWSAIGSGVAGFTANATAVLGGLQIAQLKQTVLRMIGEYVIGATSVPVALDRAFVTIGIGVVSSDAFALGTTAMPDPADEPEFPWLYWKEHALRFSSTDFAGGNREISVRESFDIKTMRKLNPRETLAMIAQYTDSAGTPPLFITASQTRVLIGT